MDVTVRRFLHRWTCPWLVWVHDVKSPDPIPRRPEWLNRKTLEKGAFEDRRIPNRLNRLDTHSWPVYFLCTETFYQNDFVPANFIKIIASMA